LKYFMQRSRWAIHFLGFLIAVALIAGIAAMPRQLHAQQPGPAAQPAATQSNSADAANSKSGGKDSSESADDAYRHTPIVKWLAKTLHMDVEATARLLEFLNFGVLALAILIPLVRVMPRVIRKRSETLKHDLEEARKTTADANARLSAIEAKLAGLDKEIAEIRTQVEEEAKNDESRIKATIGEESGRIVAAAEQEITAAAAHARRGLRHFAADLAIDQAAKQLVLTAETDRALIAEFVSEAGRNGTKGGQN
jgi:F-type H+-transporting ATPase subunit b